MLNADLMLGIKTIDRDALKEVKIKIPVRQLLRLHYLKLTAGRTFSEVIATALADHFERTEGKPMEGMETTVTPETETTADVGDVETE